MTDMPSGGARREPPRRRSHESTSFPAPSTRDVVGRGEDTSDDPVHTAAHRDRRGRGAKTPAEIPPSGWTDIFWRIYENVQEHRILAIAAGVAFYALLAIFPGIAAMVALYGLFADPATISKHLTDVSGVLPGGAIDVIGSGSRTKVMRH
jgi:membrane protein